MNKKLSYFLRFLFGIGILGFLMYRTGFENILNTFLQIKLVWLPLILFLSALSSTIGTLNIYLFVQALGYKVNYLKLIKWVWLSWATGLLVPGKFGEFSLAYLVHKHSKIKIGESTALVLLDKVITLVLFILIGSFAAFLFLPSKQALLLIGLMIAITLAGILLFFSDLGRSWIKRWLWKKLTQKFQGFSNALNHILKKPKAIIANFILTLLKMLIFTLYFKVAFMAFGQKVPGIYIFLLMALITLIVIIPVTVSGLGLREGAAVFFYTKLGVPAEAVMGTYLLLVIINYTLVGIIYATLTHEFIQQKKS